MVIYAKISPEMVNPRDIAGNTDKEEEEEEDMYTTGKIMQQHITIFSFYASDWNWYEQFTSGRHTLLI